MADHQLLVLMSRNKNLPLHLQITVIARDDLICACTLGLVPVGIDHIVQQKYLLHLLAYYISISGIQKNT